MSSQTSATNSLSVEDQMIQSLMSEALLSLSGNSSSFDLFVKLIVCLSNYCSFLHHLFLLFHLLTLLIPNCFVNCLVLVQNEHHSIKVGIQLQGFNMDSMIAIFIHLFVKILYAIFFLFLSFYPCFNLFNFFL